MAEFWANRIGSSKIENCFLTPSPPARRTLRHPAATAHRRSGGVRRPRGWSLEENGTLCNRLKKIGYFLIARPLIKAWYHEPHRHRHLPHHGQRGRAGACFCAVATAARASLGGKQILATVSQELTAEFGRGFTYTEVTRMIRFAEDFQDQQIVASLAQQLSWGHFRVLLPVKEPLARDFYAELCRIEHWDVRTLRKKIGGMLFQRTALAKKLQQVIAAEIGQLRAGQLSPDVVFRDPYFLDLLGLTGAYSEADLESAILREIEGVLMELGQRLALSRDQEEIRRLATEGQVVEKAAYLLPAPTVQPKPPISSQHQRCDPNKPPISSQHQRCDPSKPRASPWVTIPK